MNGMNKKKGRHRLAMALSRFTEIPVEVISRLPLFFLKGREEVEITGCQGILHYGEDKVVIKTSCGSFTVTGSRLLLSDFCDDTLLVRGVIDGVRFENGERGGTGEC